MTADGGENCSAERLQKALDALRRDAPAEDGSLVLWRCRYRQVLGWFQGWTRQSPEAEPMASDVLWDVVRRKGDCPADLAGFDAYLWTAARYRLLSEVRRSARWQRVDLEALTVPLALPATQEDDVLRAERSRKLEDALAQLSAAQQFCMVQRHVYGRSRAEIASLRNCDVETVKTHLRLARRRLLEMAILHELDSQSED